MKEELSVIKSFVQSLESSELSKRQEAVLLVGDVQNVMDSKTADVKED